MTAFVEGAAPDLPRMGTCNVAMVFEMVVFRIESLVGCNVILYATSYVVAYEDWLSQAKGQVDRKVVWSILVTLACQRSMDPSLGV